MVSGSPHERAPQYIPTQWPSALALTLSLRNRADVRLEHERWDVVHDCVARTIHSIDSLFCTRQHIQMHIRYNVQATPLVTDRFSASLYN